MPSNLIREWNGSTIRHRDNGYLSATDMCKACNKLFADWSRLDSSKEYLKALENRRYGDLHNGKYVVTIRGGIPEVQGTWVHRKVAIRLAQWLDPNFAIQVDDWIEELLTQGTVTLENNDYTEYTNLQYQIESAVKTIQNIAESNPILHQQALQSLKATSVKHHDNSDMLDQSLIINRIGLAYNKQLKAFEMLQNNQKKRFLTHDDWTKAYNELLQEYKDLAMQHSKLVPNGEKLYTEAEFTQLLKSEVDRRFLQIEIETRKKVQKFQEKMSLMMIDYLKSQQRRRR